MGKGGCLILESLKILLRRQRRKKKNKNGAKTERVVRKMDKIFFFSFFREKIQTHRYSKPYWYVTVSLEWGGFPPQVLIRFLSHSKGNKRSGS